MIDFLKFMVCVPVMMIYFVLHVHFGVKLPQWLTKPDFLIPPRPGTPEWPVLSQEILDNTVVKAIQHVRHVDSRPIATVVAVEYHGNFRIGVAVCRPDETFHKKYGVLEAIGKACRRETCDIPKRKVLRCWQIPGRQAHGRKNYCLPPQPVTVLLEAHIRDIVSGMHEQDRQERFEPVRGT